MPNNESDDLAQRFLDVWQEHVTRLSTDPQLAEAMSRLLTAMALPGATGYPGFAAMYPGAAPMPSGGGAGSTTQGPFPGGFVGQVPPMPAPPSGAAASDPSVWAEWMRDWVAGGAQGGARESDRAKSGDGGSKAGRHDEESKSGERAADPERPAPSDAASLDGGELYRRLVDRIETLEQRVAALEADDASGDGNAAGSVRRGSGRGPRAKRGR